MLCFRFTSDTIVCFKFVVSCLRLQVIKNYLVRFGFDVSGLMFTVCCFRFDASFLVSQYYSVIQVWCFRFDVPGLMFRVCCCRFEVSG